MFSKPHEKIEKSSQGKTFNNIEEDDPTDVKHKGCRVHKHGLHTNMFLNETWKR